MPTCSDDKWAEAADPYRTKFNYRADATRPQGYVKDWASSLLPYLGEKNADYNIYIVNATSTTGIRVDPPMMICPSDQWQNIGPTAGYKLFNNVVAPANDPAGYFPISYGVNADIATLTDAANPPVGRFGLADSVSVFHGPNGGNPLGCKVDRIYIPSQVLLFADCGVRTSTSQTGTPLDLSDALYYTSNYAYTNASIPADQAGTLNAIMQCSWLKGRVPLTRHRGKKINIGFADGHAESVASTDFTRVRISPYK